MHRKPIRGWIAYHSHFYKAPASDPAEDRCLCQGRVLRPFHALTLPIRDRPYWARNENGAATPHIAADLLRCGTTTDRAKSVTSQSAHPHAPVPPHRHKSATTPSSALHLDPLETLREDHAVSASAPGQSWVPIGNRCSSSRGETPIEPVAGGRAEEDGSASNF